ncbi:MAG: DsrE family protein [Candidatus Helarchaeota archaeon]
MPKVTIIITEAPYGTESAYGILAAAGAIATIHDTTVIFAEAGVLNAFQYQDTTDFIEYNKKFQNLPSNENKIKDFQELGIQFFVHAAALDSRKITKEDLIENIDTLTIDQISEKIIESDQVLII